MFSRFLNPTSLWWFVRMGLQFGGFWLWTNGYVSAADLDGANQAIEQAAGPVMMLIGLGANIYASFRAKVTVGGQAVGIPAIDQVVGRGAGSEVADLAKTAIAHKPTLWETLTSRLKG